jgi:hypothetical protein
MAKPPDAGPLSSLPQVATIALNCSNYLTMKPPDTVLTYYLATKTPGAATQLLSKGETVILELLRKMLARIFICFLIYSLLSFLCHINSVLSQTLLSLTIHLKNPYSFITYFQLSIFSKKNFITSGHINYNIMKVFFIESNNINLISRI